MGINIYFSNRMEHLARHYARQIQMTAPSTPFMPTEVITQTAGMGQWLSLFTAQENGISANTHYATPEDFLRDVMEEAGLCRKEEIYTQEDSLWDCFRLFEEDPAFFDGEARRFPAVREVAKYIRHDSRHRYDLAVTVADLFDQYDMYRPHMLTAWEQGEYVLQDDTFFGEQERWQCLLFRHLREVRTKKYKYSLYVELINAMNTNILQKLKFRFNHLFFFGISVLPPQTVQILSRLGEVCDITFYFLNPSHHYWYDLISDKHRAFLMQKHPALAAASDGGNPLLVNNGTTGRELFSLFMEHENCVNAMNFDLFEEHFSATQLGDLQGDITHLAGSFSGRKADGSISIHSAITPLREVEILYDHICSAMDEGITPDEILVMAPDIDLYRPYIEAVFSPRRENDPLIPFTISDYSYDSEKSLIALFEKICFLNTTSFSAEDVFALAEHSLVCAVFGFSRDDLVDIRSFLKDLGLRWGSDAEQARREGIEENRFHSWEHILHTAAVSFAVKGDDEIYSTSRDQYLCQDILEGAAGESLFTFFGFVYTLLDFTRELSGKKTPARWIQLLQKWLLRFFPPDTAFDDTGQAGVELSLIEEKLELLQEHTEDLIQTQEFSLVRTAFFDSLRTAKKSAFLARGITFCSPVPMRSIPFDMVAFLGMNSGEFPRLSPPRAFNLMEANHHPGDRNSKNSDRYLFLEALISARRRFYLSFLGRDQHDMSEKTPATVVTELLEYINGTKELLQVQHHPLYGFDSRYFKNDPAWFTYQYSPPGKTLPPASRNHGHPEGGDIPEEIDIACLVGFYKNPIRYYYRLLGISFFDDAWTIPGEEALDDGDNLVKYFLKKTCLTHEREESLSEYRNKLQMRGLWPPAGYGEYLCKKACDGYEGVFEKMRTLRTGENPPLHHETICTVGDHTLTLRGEKLPWYTHKNQNIFVVSSVSSHKQKAKYLIEAKLYALFLSSCDEIDCVWYVGPNSHGGSPDIVEFPTSRDESAGELLSRLAALFLQVHRKIPLLFGPAAGEKWIRQAEKCKKKKGEKKMTAQEILSVLQEKDAAYDPALRHFLSFVDSDIFTKHYEQDFRFLAQLFFKGGNS
ncbi:MAG: exodeoxyribonuclease V subunit gamma [Fibrobacterota bacterium]